jgi:hypothetical protein
VAVTFDTVGPSAAGASATSPTQTLSWNHTCSGTERLLVVGVALGTGNSSGFTAAVTCNGVAMRAVAKANSNNGTVGFVQLFVLAAPAVGANTVLVTPNVTADALSCGSVSFNGVDQTTPVITSVAAGGSSAVPSVVVPSTTSGNMIVDGACSGGPLTSSNQTQRWLRNTNTSTGAGNGAGSTAAAGGPVTMSYVATNDWWGIAAVEVRAATSPTGGGGFVVSRRKPNKLPT